MKYTKNQHVLSQWILRNFRSDDTANMPKSKKRVWCHTIYFSSKENDIKEIPLPISSVAVKKDCFMLFDKDTDAKFDIEDELSEYEKETSDLFNELIHDHKFYKLTNSYSRGNQLGTILNFMIIQMLLNLHNPQNKIENKEDFFAEYMRWTYDNIVDKITNHPKELSYLFDLPVYKKLLRVANSKSNNYEKSKAIFILLLLIESRGLPIIGGGMLSILKNVIFKGIRISGIYHTGHEFDSTELRPVFTIGPNVFSVYEDQQVIYLPLSHNFAIRFLVSENKYDIHHLDIFSPDPSKLKCRSSKNLRVFKVSFDYIDNVAQWIIMGNQGHSKTIYTPYELRDTDAYLELQDKNGELFYKPEKPEFVII